MENYTLRTTCRACGSNKLTPFWTAGNVYVVRFPHTIDKNSLMAPLTLCACEDCWLVQLQHTVRPDLLYSEFFYRSGVNEMMRKELADIASEAYKCVAISKDSWILDIGCNDGTLLNSYPQYDGMSKAARIGIDPAMNLQNPGRQEGDWYFIQKYFSADEVLRITGGGTYEIITAISMFYDLESPLQFLLDIRQALSPTGVFIVQMNYLLSMLNRNCVDNICHEHLTYFSLTSLLPLFNAAGLDIFRVETNDCNGGSIRVYACHKGKRPIENSVKATTAKEKLERLNQFETYGHFSDRVQAIVKTLNEWVQRIVSRGEKIYVYGASTRGTTLLQLINTRGIVAAAERDQNKYGRYMVGSWLPIISEEKARTAADYFLILPWHFWPGIRQREKEWIEKGGKCIVPLPRPMIHSQMSTTAALFDSDLPANVSAA